MNRIYKCFPGGKFKVLTLSYDDGKVQDRRLVDIFNKNGLRATFNVNSQLTDMDIRIDADEWSELYNNHEIALHTSTHPTLNRCGSYEVAREILEDKTAIEKIIKKPVRGMALPNGAGNKLITSIAADLGIKYIRPAADQYAVVKSAMSYADCCEGPILLGDENGFSMPADYMNWLPTCHHNHNLVEFGKRFMALTKKQYLYMMYVWGHSFEFDRNNNWSVMEEFAEVSLSIPLEPSSLFSMYTYASLGVVTRSTCLDTGLTTHNTFTSLRPVDLILPSSSLPDM